MRGSGTLAYRGLVTKDPEPRQGVAEIPTRQIAGLGADVPEVLDHVRAMLTFHRECLRQEGQPVPAEEGEDEGRSIRVTRPPHAAEARSGEGDASAARW